MTKFRKSILIFGIIALCIGVALGTVVLLSLFGSITTQQIELEFKVVDENKASYDGEPLKPHDYLMLNGDLIKGHRPVVTFSGEQTDAGISASGMTVKIVDESDYDVTDKYKIKVHGGTLTVGLCEVTVRLTPQEVVYSGEKMLIEDYTVVHGSLAEGHRIGATVKGAGVTLVGETLSSDDVLPIIYDGAGKDVSSNYVTTFQFNPNDIRITARPITLRPIDEEKVYDGKVLECSRYQIVNGSLVAGHTVDPYITDTNGQPAQLIGVGEKIVSIDSASTIITDSKGRDVSSNYLIYTERGKIKVTARPLSLHAVGAEKVYDGIALECNKYEISGGSLATGHSITVSYASLDGGQASLASAGNIMVAISAVRVTATGTDVSSNYELMYSQPAELIIRPAQLVLTAKSKSWVYDGKEHSLAPHSDEEETTPAIATGLVQGDAVSVKYTGTITDVGTATNGIASHTITGNSGNNYNVQYVDGTLTVTRADLNISLKPLEKQYDGKAFTGGDETEYLRLVAANTFYDFSFEGFTLETNLYDMLDNIVEPTTTTYIFNEYTIKNGDKDVTENFDVRILAGALKISRRKVTVGGSAAKIYDGTMLFTNSMPFITLSSGTDEGLVAGHQIASFICENVAIANSPTPTKLISISVVDESGLDVLGYYNITNFNDSDTVDVTVNERSVSAYTQTLSKVYDGTPLYGGTYIVSGLASGDYIKTEEGAQAQQTVYTASAVENKPTDWKIYNINNEDVTCFYSLEDKDITYGTLSISKAKITVTMKNDTDTFTGTPLDIGSADYTVEEFAKDWLEIVSWSVSGAVNAGPYESTAAFSFRGDRVEESKNYEIVVVSGVYEITPAKVTLTYNGAITKVYDGQKAEVDCSKIVVSDSAFIVAEVSYNSLVNVSDSGTLTLRSPVFALASGTRVAEGNIVCEGDCTVSVTITQRTLSITLTPVTISATDVGTAFLNGIVNVFGLATTDTVVFNDMAVIISGPPYMSHLLSDGYDIIGSNGASVKANYIVPPIVMGTVTVIP